MEVIFNAFKDKPVDHLNEYTCEKCGSILRVSPNETFVGFMGDVYFNCPVCGDNSLAYETDGYEEDYHIAYPRSFYYHTHSPNSSNIHECSEAEVNGMVQKLIEQEGYCNSRSKIRMDMAQMGDTVVLILEDDVIDDHLDNPNGKGTYRVLICRNCDEAYFDKS